MTAKATYNICYCSEGESGSSEGGYNNPLNERRLHLTDQRIIMDRMRADEEITLKSVAGSNSVEAYPSVSLKEKIMKIRKKYSMDDMTSLTAASRLLRRTPTVATSSTPSINTDAEDPPPPKSNSSVSSSASSLPPTGCHANGMVNRSDFKNHAKSTKASKILTKNLSSANATSNDSDTMQEDGEISSTTIQELEQAWDVYQEPLYATGSDAADEERLDPSSLIGDWDEEEEEDGSIDEDATVFMKHGFDWSEESDTEDVGKLIEDSRMQLGIVRDVIQQLRCDDCVLTYSHYIESCATCRTNINCLENLLRALGESMGEKELEHEHVTSLKELLEQWRGVVHQLEKEQPKNLEHKSKVRRRLKKKKSFRKFSLFEARKASIDTEQCKTFEDVVLPNRSGSLPEVEMLESMDTNLEQYRKTFAEVARQTVEGDAKLMSALCFGLVLFLLALKLVYSYCSDIDLFSFDVTFFKNYLRENPPA